MDKLVGVLFECCDGEQGKLIILCNLVGGAGDNHGAQLFVCLVEVFHSRVGDGNEVCIEVFRVADDGLGIDDIDEGLGRQVAGALSLCGCKGALCLVVLAELGLDIVVDTLYLLRARLVCWVVQ